MPQRKEILDKLSIYIPRKEMEEKPVERLMKLGKKKDRSINCLVVEAILEYLKREEKQGVTHQSGTCPARELPKRKAAKA